MDDALHDERITAYLDETMTAAERESFEAELAASRPLRQRVENRRLAIEAVRQAGAVRTVKALHEEMMKELKPSTATIVQMRRWSRRGLRIAAGIIFIVLAAGAWYVYALSPQKLYGQAFVDMDLSGSRSGGEATTATAERYRLRQYAQITGRLNESFTPFDSLLVGLSFMHTGSFDSAAQWLQAIRHAGNPYREDGDFYLALAWLRQEKYEAAITLLSAIRAHENHLYYHQVSPALIRKIGVLKWKG